MLYVLCTVAYITIVIVFASILKIINNVLGENTPEEISLGEREEQSGTITFCFTCWPIYTLWLSSIDKISDKIKSAIENLKKE